MPRRNINQHRGRTAIVELLFAFYVDAGGGEGGKEMEEEEEK